MVTAICTAATVSAASLAPAAAVPPTADFYATRPQFERPFPAQRVPAGLGSLSAASCGTCHAEIEREWRQSVHAQAWPDPQFQAELKKQPGVAWLCVNCHTPLVNQLDSVVVALRGDDVERPVRAANPLYEPRLRDESITCAVCHVKDGVIVGPYRDVRAPHPTRYDPSFRSATLCLRCHQAVQTYPGKNFICTFATGDEWRAGPYARRGTVCQDCHMNAVTRSSALGGAPRRVGTHVWMGSHLRKGLESEPALWDSIAAARPPGIELRAAAAPLARAGRTAQWRVVAVNANAGHLLPTGDPERQVLVELTVLGARREVLARTQIAIAQKYEWWPTVRKLWDRRVAPGDSVAVTLRYRVPRGDYRLVARAVNERISDANAEYHKLPATYVRRAEVARVERAAAGR